MNAPRILELCSPDNFAGSLKIDDETRADFLNNPRANPGYICLTKSPGFDSGRRRRLEEACWLHHNRMTGELFGALLQTTAAKSY